MNTPASRWVEMAIEHGLTLYGENQPLKEMVSGTSLTAIAEELASIARFIKPEELIPLAPPSVQRALRDLTRDPPTSVEDFFYVESSVYKASYFEGLSEEQSNEKAEQAKLEGRKERLDAIWSIHNYFANA